MKINFTKEQCTKLADLEDGSEIGAGPVARDPAWVECEMCASSKWKSACPECDGTGRIYTLSSPQRQEAK